MVVRAILFVGLAAFVPLFYFLAVIAGFLPFGGILIITMRNLTSPLLVLSLGRPAITSLPIPARRVRLRAAANRVSVPL